jgi:flagellar biosynthesis protein FlhF
MSVDRHVAVERPRRSRNSVQADARSGVIARLTSTGLDPMLAAAVAGRMSDSDCRGGSEQTLRRALAAEVEELCGVDNEFARYEVFVGPPGVGKTTTIAKIAAQEVAARRAPLSLVAADAFRAGAIEQLRSYAHVMGLPLRVARSGEEFDQAIAGTRQTALVDTAGRAPSDDGIRSLFDVLDRKRGVRTHLVMAADTSAATARRLLDRYAPLKPARVVITKLDESESVMPVFDAVRERGLPVSYLTAGQRVPEDLWRATPASLAAALLRESAMEGTTCH